MYEECRHGNLIGSCDWLGCDTPAPPPDSLEKWAEDAAEFLARTVQAPDLLARARALGVGKP